MQGKLNLFKKFQQLLQQFLARYIFNLFKRAIPFFRRTILFNNREGGSTNSTRLQLSKKNSVKVVKRIVLFSFGNSALASLAKPAWCLQGFRILWLTQLRALQTVLVHLDTTRREGIKVWRRGTELHENFFYMDCISYL